MSIVHQIAPRRIRLISINPEIHVGLFGSKPMRRSVDDILLGLHDTSIAPMTTTLERGSLN